ncbi:response regulator transcription factor [Coralloluteibacterium stylophorae]|uniref:Response regulator transcription factor n=1 Tax=Coralloluteibacterium stylophorae TaxID=1776034 RepID=A0A8J7VTD6_9GAMM|nr:response regulator transcription factor [Coralloluteibacterium stylophorae]MBS7456708.1 response regulator transcription factor [Coralloluteibacterium stylophorae]
MEGAELRLVLADDHPVVLMGLRATLERESSAWRVVGEAERGEQLMELLSTCDCDVLVTDFAMPYAGPRGERTGLDLLRDIRARHPGLPVVVQTMIENPALLRAMLDTGILGLLDKGSALGELANAVHAVRSRRRYLSCRLRERLEETSRLPGARLSPKEQEVVRLFAQGLSVTEIAERLHRSVKTISRQKIDAMGKLGVSSPAQLYDCAREIGLIP